MIRHVEMFCGVKWKGLLEVNTDLWERTRPVRETFGNYPENHLNT